MFTNLTLAHLSCFPLPLQAVFHQRDLRFSLSRTRVLFLFCRRSREPTESVRSFGGGEGENLRLFPSFQRMRFTTGFDAGFDLFGRHPVSAESPSRLRDASRPRQGRNIYSFHRRKKFSESRLLRIFPRRRDSLDAVEAMAQFSRLETQRQAARSHRRHYHFSRLQSSSYSSHRALRNGKNIHPGARGAQNARARRQPSGSHLHSFKLRSRSVSSLVLFRKGGRKGLWVD